MIGRGGQTRRRPDQAYSPPPGVVLGPGTKNIFRGRLVIVFGTGPNTGLFVYNGTPAKGNLVAEITAPGVTSDPFGNSIPSSGVMNVGVWNAAGTLLQHFGINNSGTTFIVGPDGVTRIQINNGTGGTGPDIRFFNDFGAVILVVDPSRGGTFQYQDNNSAVQGVLIGAQVGKNTTDPINGTAVGAGVNLIDPAFGDTLTAVGAIINLKQVLFTANAVVSANTGSGATSPFLSLAGPEQTSAGHAVLRVYGTSVDGTVPGGVIISTTDPPVRAASALLEVQGSQALKGIATPASPPAGNALLFADTSGFLRTLAGLAGDTNVYPVGEQVSVVSSTFTISSTSFGTITGLSVPVGIGTYVVEVWLNMVNATAADAAEFAFNGPAAAAAPQLVEFVCTSGTATGVVTHSASATYTTAFDGQGVAGNQSLVIRATVQFTAAGTLALQGRELVAANTIAVSAGSRMKLRPVI